MNVVNAPRTAVTFHRALIAREEKAAVEGNGQ